MSTDCLAIVVGIATIVNAVALVYDIWRRYKKKSASFIQVPNKNNGGFDEFGISKSIYPQATLVEAIWIKSDGTVEVKWSNKKIEAYGNYIKWLS